VEEAPPVGLIVGVGYDTEAGPRGSFSVSHANPGGFNRSLAFQGRASEIEERLQWVVQEPRLFGRPVTALINAFWENREEVSYTVDRRSVGFRLEKKLPRRWRHYLRYNFRKEDLSEVVDEVKAKEEKLENVKLGNVAYALVRDTRDDPFSPTRGGYGIAEVELFAPGLFSDSSFVKVLLQGSAVKSFRNGTSFASALRVGAAEPFGNTERVPLSERFFAGGDSTLRGFARDSVAPEGGDVLEGGEALLLLNEEWRFPIWGPVKGTVFYDAGNVFLRVAELDPTELRHVLGLGVRVETPIGPLRLEYGRKVDREPDEASGELFIAIGSAF
jgi:outer membrane protein insertion porin family